MVPSGVGNVLPPPSYRSNRVKEVWGYEVRDKYGPAVRKSDISWSVWVTTGEDRVSPAGEVADCGLSIRKSVEVSKWAYSVGRPGDAVEGDGDGRQEVK
jgi:hypothetical protein